MSQFKTLRKCMACGGKMRAHVAGKVPTSCDRCGRQPKEYPRAFMRRAKSKVKPKSLRRKPRWWERQ